MFVGSQQRERERATMCDCVLEHVRLKERARMSVSAIGHVGKRESGSERGPTTLKSKFEFEQRPIFYFGL